MGKICISSCSLSILTCFPVKCRIMGLLLLSVKFMCSGDCSNKNLPIECLVYTFIINSAFILLFNFPPPYTFCSSGWWAGLDPKLLPRELWFSVRYILPKIGDIFWYWIYSANNWEIYSDIGYTLPKNGRYILVLDIFCQQLRGICQLWGCLCALRAQGCRLCIY